MQTRARIGIALLALGIAGALALGFAPRPVAVELVPAARGPLAVTVEEEGKTRVRDRYGVSAPVAGYARRIELHVGDPVAAGQVLAHIEPARADALDPRAHAEAAARVQAAAAAEAAARETARAAAAQAELARQEAERAESLRRSNFISAQSLDKARSELRRALAAQSAADHDARAARFELERARAVLAAPAEGRHGAATVAVRSPVAGQVLKVVHESEGPVAAGGALLEVGDPRSLDVEVEVLSTQAVRIAPGTPVLFERWGGETALRGTVRRVEPTGFTKVSALGVEEQRVRVIVDFDSPREEWRRIGDGYRVEARFVVWEAADVLQVPASALFRHDGGWAVFVADGGRARLRPLETGQRAGLQVQVLSGLQAGETVIAHPDDQIRDGGRVQAR